MFGPWLCTMQRISRRHFLSLAKVRGIGRTDQLWSQNAPWTDQPFEPETSRT